VDRRPDAEAQAREIQALRASEERYRAIVEAAVDGVWMLGPDDRTSFVNPAMAEMIGYEVDELIGRRPSDFTTGDGAEALEEALTRRRIGITERYELTFKRKDGSDLVAEIAATPLFADDGTYMGSTAMVVDTTERRRAQQAREHLEARLQQAQRLETVGQLAGGIAHDFNNILAVILNAAYFVRRQLPDDSPVRDDVDEIRHAAERASELTRQLLIFSRRDPVVPQVIDVNGLLSDMDRLLRRTLGERVELVTVPCDGDCHVEADAAQLEQVVMNLVMNARDAMPDGGTITVGAELEDGRVVMSVSDEGAGMGPDVVARAFEPFFTTKPKGAGTGLGLATVYGTVTRAGGETAIESEPGRGTTVRVRLPRVAAPPEDAERPPPGGADVDGTGFTILLAEDEDAVRDLTRRILISSGFECLCAPSGSDALSLYEQHRDRIDLLLTDVVMPGMSGNELAARIRARDGELPVVFMSGYADEAMLADALPDGSESLLQKPFNADALLRCVRAALPARERQ
jgi:PAS domain S-box-containing protein